MKNIVKQRIELEKILSFQVSKEHYNYLDKEDLKKKKNRSINAIKQLNHTMKDKLNLPYTAKPEAVIEENFEYKSEFLVHFDYCMNLLKNFP